MDSDTYHRITLSEGMFRQTEKAISIWWLADVEQQYKCNTIAGGRCRVTRARGRRAPEEESSQRGLGVRRPSCTLMRKDPILKPDISDEPNMGGGETTDVC